MAVLIDRDKLIRDFKTEFPKDVNLNLTTICDFIEDADPVELNAVSSDWEWDWEDEDA